MRLYNGSYSGNSYKARLLLAHLGVPCEIVEVDILNGASRTPDFLKINAQRPHAGAGRRRVHSRRVQRHPPYLARGTKYLPDERKAFALVFQWLFSEQYSHDPFIATSRFWLQHKPDSRARRFARVKTRRRLGRLKVMEDHLANHDFFVAVIPSPTSRSSLIPRRARRRLPAGLFRRSERGLDGEHTARLHPDGMSSQGCARSFLLRIGTPSVFGRVVSNNRRESDYSVYRTGAGLERQDKGVMTMYGGGKRREVSVESYEHFGEWAYRLRLVPARRHRRT